MSRLKTFYENVIRPDLLTKGNYKSIMEVPALSKITLHMTIKDTLNDKKSIVNGLILLERITGQRPTVIRSRKSVASFHLKEGSIIGCKVSLTGENMYNFLDKLVYIVLPRVKDFKTIESSSFQANGNYSLGLSDSLVFPEIESEYGKIPKTYGLDISFNILGKDINSSKLLISAFQLPLKDNKDLNHV